MIIPTMGEELRVIIIGANGGIGTALIDHLSASDQVAQIYALSRQGKPHKSHKVVNMVFDFTKEDDLEKTSAALKAHGDFDLIILATGFLHNPSITPEKTYRSLTFEGLEMNFRVNTIGPAMTAKYFLPLLRRDRKTIFAALSARVGSISDNGIGGWYAYRASKAALNMVIKTLAIEQRRRSKDTIILGLHPGTVDTNLSKPFQANVAEGKLFTPEYASLKLLNVIDKADQSDSGHLIDWAGKQIPF
ncbi:NAD(P)-dependent dehydrogenase (short-subunit alcohol dehydrogenase family) [Litorimonas taeanensis]|uniref:NAD(P)-dependent dehydrogenase (Short-subunit alcohol dehydrogenase family) n=1 Tax=Litorimonas taeanensis TaxID=568099 RepID=A0A420WJ58_9PROT|nr:SDR family NAD(P)-dependent oxidoreductase [Litorimonas taeanensis]RKQ70962.1 NAD(P)-dependent dehydrogenase (short-subunit alcohol dehydrogenase family) [Litorimonas taeanensis]